MWSIKELFYLICIILSLFLEVNYLNIINVIGKTYLLHFTRKAQLLLSAQSGNTAIYNDLSPGNIG